MKGKGRKQSVKTKKKISLSSKGRLAWNKGKKCPNLPGNTKTHYNGESHWNWQGGKSFEIYPKEFSEKLKKLII